LLLRATCLQQRIGERNRTEDDPEVSRQHCGEPVTCQAIAIDYYLSLAVHCLLPSGFLFASQMQYNHPFDCSVPTSRVNLPD